jgi:hypothetical protein
MSDETEQFERLLKCQPLQQVPAKWRNEILSAAGHAQVVRSLQPVIERSFLSTLNHRLASLLWPHPVAWSGLAAIWIFIFALNFSNRDRVPIMAEKASPPSPEVVAELRQQQRLYVELMDVKDLADVDRQKVFVPKPRSERVGILTA